MVDFLTEQIDAIETNSTLVETYKKAHGQPGTFFQNFNEVMGPPYIWLIPIFGAPVIEWTEPLYADDHDHQYFRPSAANGGSRKGSADRSRSRGKKDK